MNIFPKPSNEGNRLEKLANYGLLDLTKESDLDSFTEIACLISNCAASLIATMGDDVQIVHSCVGVELDSVPRQSTICQHTLMNNDVLVIEDTLLDDRSRFNTMMIDAGVRFYCGIPLFDNEGFALGTLCVFDFEPKELTSNQIQVLQKLQQPIVNVLLNKKKELHAEYFTDTFNLTNNIVCVLDGNTCIKETNPTFDSLFELGSAKQNHILFSELFDYQSEDIDKISNTKENTLNTRTIKSNGEVIEIEWNIKQSATKSEFFCFGRNITAELKEKNILENSEKKFKKFFESSIGLMTLHDLQGNLLAVNEEGRKALMYSNEEVTKMSLFDFIDEKEKPLVAQYLAVIAQDKKSKGLMRLNAKDGSKLYWMYQNILETDNDGNLYVVSTALNITERILLEKKLKHTHEVLEQINDVALVGGWEINPETNYINWSKTSKLISGLEEESAPNFDQIIALFHEDSQQLVSNLIRKAIVEGISFDAEVEFNKINGPTIWVRIKGIAEFKDGTCTRLYGIIQDIDDRKRTYLALENNEAMLQAFVKDLPASVAMFDSNLNCLTLSVQLAEEHYKSQDDFIGKNLYDLFPNISDNRKEIYNNALKGISYGNEDEIFFDFNTEVPQHFNWAVKPWFISNGTVGGVILFLQNITASVTINEELVEAKKLAEIASKAKTEFLANMSHEIRTPLNGVIGFSDLLLKTPLNEIQLQYLNYINESGNSLLHIINDILDFSKIESGKLELYIDKYKLSDIGDQVINVVLYQAQRKHIELLLDVQQDLPNYVWIDEARIKQVLMNLLGNAVKFTESGEIELRIRKIATTDDKITLRFAVRDTGIGIPIEKQQRIFDAFTQEDSSVSKRYGGTGLGLTISNNILKYMGSTLLLKSEIGVGSFFYFDIEVPFENEVEDAEDIIDLQKVLVVDDNEKNRIILKQMLSFKNVHAELAANGLEAIQMLMKGNQYDAILMDYHMPILSGLETIDKIKELFKSQNNKVPLIILHTSSEEQEVIANIRKEEKSYFLLKPIKSNDLYSVLQRASKQVNKDAETTIVDLTKPQVLEQKLNVLLADDNPVNMALNFKIMEVLVPNASLVEAENGAIALEACKEQNFDLVLMDIQMPVMDGIEATREIRKLPNFANVPIIGVTAGNIVVEKEKCLNAGITNLLAKPLKQNDLLQMLANYFSISDLSLPTDTQEKDIIDLSVLEEQIGSDQKFKAYFLDLLITELNSSLFNLKQIEDNFNNQSVKMFLHKLKGTAGMSGLVSLLEIVKKWEETEVNSFNFNELSMQLHTQITNAQRIIQRMNR